MSKWQSTTQTLPAEGQVVMTAIIDENGERNTQKLKRYERLWYLEDGSMYVYYTPTHWKPVNNAGCETCEGRYFPGKGVDCPDCGMESE